MQGQELQEVSPSEVKPTTLEGTAAATLIDSKLLTDNNIDVAGVVKEVFLNNGSVLKLGC